MNINKVFLCGRLTRDPEMRSFANGGKVAKFGLAVNDRKKNKQTGEWEQEPIFLDVEAFNRGEFGKTADVVEKYLRKGSEAFIEGKIQMDQWTAADGQKRSKVKIVADAIQFGQRKNDGAVQEHKGDDAEDAGRELPYDGPKAEDIPF